MVGLQLDGEVRSARRECLMRRMPLLFVILERSEESRIFFLA